MSKLATVNPSRSFLVGIDTGGTYTDAVACDLTTTAVVNKAKVPTNHDDLAACVSTALRAVIDGSLVSSSEIALVSISTTLATNALVEGVGRPAALIAIGFDDATLNRGGLKQVLDQDPLVSLRGGHSSHGQEITPLDLAPLKLALTDIDSRVDAYAIVGSFSVRNSAHEAAVADLIRTVTTKPVTCSHELSEQLNGPKRAVTALLNARLIALVNDLLLAVEASMVSLEVTAPLMVVRGDGSLVSAAFVRQRPIETILSGPAASVLGSSALAGIGDAVVADLGGTTTDVAVVADGKPVSNSKGALVGDHATMIDAIRVHTAGIGGDSHVRNAEFDTPQLSIGPRRVTPLVVAAQKMDGVRQMLASQTRNSMPLDTDGIYVWLRDGASKWKARSKTEEHILQTLKTAPSGCAYQDVVTSGLQRNAINRLLNASVVAMAGFTPTDAMHVLKRDVRYESEPAILGAHLLARQRDRFGQPLATSEVDISEQVHRHVALKVATTMLRAACDHDDLPVEYMESPLVMEALSTSGRRRDGVLSMHVGLNRPLIAVGAPAALYFPEVGRLLDTDVIVPEHFEIANALGAATGMITLSTHITVSAPRRGLFRVHSGDEPKNFYELIRAQEFAELAAGEDVAIKMALAGANAYELSNNWVTKEVVVADRPLFIEASLTTTASGRPST
jgi:N-methylhydantoinase A/oxoprolinase/acetone carboxylase beta subunit